MSTATTETTAEEHQLRTEVTASLQEGTQVSLRARDHAFTIDEPADLGGADTGANPVEHLLAALGSCQAITYSVWAEKLGLRLDDVDITLTGDIDLRGFFGLAETIRPGYSNIDVNVTISGPETAETYDALIDTVEKHCPVLDNLAATVPVNTSVTVA